MEVADIQMPSQRYVLVFQPGGCSSDQRMHLDWQCHWKQILHGYFEQYWVTKITPWYVNIIPAYQTSFKIRPFGFHSCFPVIITYLRRSQQLSHYYSISIADILQDNWKNSVLVSIYSNKKLISLTLWSTGFLSIKLAWHAWVPAGFLFCSRLNKTLYFDIKLPYSEWYQSRRPFEDYSGSPFPLLRPCSVNEPRFAYCCHGCCLLAGLCHWRISRKELQLHGKQNNKRYKPHREETSLS